MTNLPPSDPRSPQRNTLGFDEFIGIFVAFSIIGTILFWSLAKSRGGFNLTSLSSPSPIPAEGLTPTPTATQASPLPTVTPARSSEVLAPVPSVTPSKPAIPAVIPLPITTSTVAPKPVEFVDVPQDYWARPFIVELSERGIVGGFAGGYFRPNDPVTRAEFAAMLQKAFSKTPVRSAETFKDVPPKYWAAPAIDETHKAGFLNGYPQNVFQPEQRIPRVQALVSLVNGLGLNTTSNSTQVLAKYQDAKQIPNYGTDKVAAATQAGLVVNHPDKTLLKPTQEVTRAEVAALIYQGLVKEGKAKKIDSAYVIQP